jgi:hypothetical protein
MIAVTDQYQRASFARKLQRFQVNLRDERARGVDHTKAAILRFEPDAGGNPVRAEYEHRAFRYLFDGLDEDCAAPPKLVDDVPIVNNLVMDIHRPAVGL